MVAPVVSVTAAERDCDPPGLIVSGPRPLLAVLGAVSVTVLTGQVANGTEGLLTPAVEAKMLACPGPIGVTVPAGNIPEVLVTVPEVLTVVPGVAMVAIVVSLVDHWKGAEWSTAPPAGVAVRSAVMSHGGVAGGVWELQTVGSLL
jgi:hypothetical protein